MATANVKTPAKIDDRASEIESLRQVMHGLLSTLCHDLRTPLSAISGWLFLLESEKLDAAGSKRALQKIRANIDEQAQLIDDILLLSRIETGHLQPEPAVISANALISATLEKVRPSAVAASVNLHTTMREQNATVMADSDQLGRAFEILMAHAIKSTSAGGTIDVATRASDAHVLITIADAGQGASPADRAFARAPFGENNSASGNTPPGADSSLMLARALVEIQDGQMRADSPGPSLGTTFAVLLPLIAGPSRNFPGAKP